jgi:hypothetical protein
MTADKEFFIYSSSYRYQNDRIEFSETDEQKTSVTWFTLQHVGPKRTKLTLDFYITRSLAGQIMFTLFRKRSLQKQFRKSMEKLVGLVKELRIPSAV